MTTLVRERPHASPSAGRGSERPYRHQATPPAQASKPEPSLADRFYDFLALPTAQLDARCAELARAELALPEPERRLAVIERLHAWLDLDSEDARVLAASWARAVRGMTPELQTLSEEAERAAVLDGCSFQEFEQLSAVVPWMREERAMARGLVVEATPTGGVQGRLR